MRACGASRMEEPASLYLLVLQLVADQHLRWFERTRALRGEPERASTHSARDGSLSQHVELPEIPAARRQEGLDREPPRAADRLLQITHLLEIRADGLVDRNLHAGRARDQDPL